MTRKPGLPKQIASHLETLREATVDDLLPLFPGVTRTSLQNAFRQACHYKLIRMIRPGQRDGKPGSKPAIYGPILNLEAEDDEPLRQFVVPFAPLGRRVPINSVFALGQV